MKPFAQYHDRNIIDTHHSIDRGYDGRGVDHNVYPTPESFKSACLWVIKNGIDAILNEHRDASGTYLLHSKSTNIGIVLHWRRDGESRQDRRNHAIIVTVLPVRRTHYSNNPSDTLILTELVSALKTRVIKRLQERVKNVHLFENLRDAGVLSTMRIGNWSVELFENEIVDVTVLPICVE